MSARDCPQVSPEGVSCGVIGPHTLHAGVDEDGQVVTWLVGEP